MSRVWGFPTSLERRVYRAIAQDVIEYPRHVVIEALAVKPQNRFPWNVVRRHLVQGAYVIKPFQLRLLDRSARPIVEECANECFVSRTEVALDQRSRVIDQRDSLDKVGNVARLLFDPDKQRAGDTRRPVTVQSRARQQPERHISHSWMSAVIVQKQASATVALRMVLAQADEHDGLANRNNVTCELQRLLARFGRATPIGHSKSQCGVLIHPNMQDLSGDIPVACALECVAICDVCSIEPFSQAFDFVAVFGNLNRNGVAHPCALQELRKSFGVWRQQRTAFDIRQELLEGMDQQVER